MTLLLKNLYACLFIFIQFTCFAQGDTFGISVITAKVVDGTTYNAGIDNAGNCYMLGYDTKLSKYNSSMDHVLSVQVSLKNEQDKNLDFEFIQILNDQLCLFVSLSDKKANKKTVYVQTIDKNTLLQNNDRRKIGEFTIRDGSYGLDILVIQNTIFKVSKDRSKLAISHVATLSNVINILVFESNMNLLWSKQIVLKSKGDANNAMKFDVNDTGDLAYLFFSTDANRLLNSGQKSVYYMQVYFNKGAIVKEFDLSISEKASKAMTLIIDNKSIICAGYVCKLEPENAFGSNKMWASCFFKIDIESQSLIISQCTNFDAELLNESNSDEGAKLALESVKEDKNFIYLNNQEIISIKRNDNGDIFLMSEFQKFLDHGAFCGSILIISFSNSGEIHWSKKIYKKQYYVEGMPSWMSFASCTVKDNLYLFFNEYPNNLNLKRGTLPEMYKARQPSVLAAVKIDVKGTVTEKAIIEITEEDVQMKPSSFTMIRDNELIMVGYTKKSTKLFKAIFTR